MLVFFFTLAHAFAQDTTCEDLAIDSCLNDEDDLDCTWEIVDDEGVCVTASEEPAVTEPIELDEPVKAQSIQIGEVDVEDVEENWKPSLLQTYGTRFLIRGKEALTWSLNIEDSGFHNEAIQTSYIKVLTIVNSLFILGLLAIAAMWMFSIVIPRRYLKEVIVYFAAAVIFVNFAMPLTRLFIDSTNLLQKTLLTEEGEKIAITDIVETPIYEQAIGYENLASEESVEEINIAITNDPDAEEVIIGKISGEPEKKIMGTITGGESPGIVQMTVPESDEKTVALNPNQTIIMPGESKFHPETEQSIFSFLLIAATGLAYFVLALIFVLRIVILWALLILSPILFLLGIFKLTRGWFYNWLAIYGRWLLIGPLVALGIAVIVNIWKTVGLPITVSPEFTGDTFQNVSNISFLLPGDTIPNTLSTTSEMMEYLVFLMMLYIPIFFGFALTRQKMLRGATTAVVEKWRERRPIPVTPTEQETRERVTEKEGARGVAGALKDILTAQIARVTETAMPAGMRTSEAGKSRAIPSAASFLPENLALTETRDMLGLLGASKESRKSRDLTIERLANPAVLSDPKEREKYQAVRNEIERRSDIGHPEAVILMNEVKEKEKTMAESSAGPAPAAGQVTAGPAPAEAHVTVETGEAKMATPTIEKVIEEKEIKEKEKETERIVIQKEKPAEELKGEDEEEQGEEPEEEKQDEEAKEGNEQNKNETEETEPAEIENENPKT